MSVYSIIEGAEVQIESLYHATKRFEKRVELKIGGLALVLFLSMEAPFSQETTWPDNQQVVIENVIQAANSQDKRADMLEKSLMRHQGEKLNLEEMTAFKTASEEIKVLPFKDALVRYNELSRHITSDLLLEDGLMVHLSQYFEQPTDQLVYSVEREARFLRTGHAPMDGFRRLIAKEVEIARQMA